MPRPVFNLAHRFRDVLISAYFCTLISMISTHNLYFLDYYNGVGCNSFPIQQGNLWNSKQHNTMETKSLGMSTSSFKRTSTLCKLCYVGLYPTWRCCYHNVCGTPIHTGVFVFIFETFSLIMENFTLFWPSSWHGFHCSTSIRLRQIPGKKKLNEYLIIKLQYVIAICNRFSTFELNWNC